MKHFPFLFLFVFLFSCNDEKNGTIVDNYKEFVDKATFYRDSNVNLDSAYFYFNKAKLSCDKNQADRIVYLLAEMAKIQKIRGDYSGSEATATEAFDYFNKVNNPDFIYSIYSVLGTSYQKLFDYENALKYYKLCLNENVDENYQRIIKNNIGVVHMDNNNLKMAIETLEPLLKSETINQNRIVYAKIIDNLGFSYFKNKQNEKGYNYLKESLRIRDSIDDDYEKIASLVHLSRFYIEKDSVLAKEFAKKALQSSISINSPDDRLEALALLVNLSKPSESKEYFNTYIKINDSVNKDRQTAKNQFANIKYESSLAIKNAENQKKQKIIYLLLFIVSVLIAVFIFYIIRKKNKEKLKTISYETETRISKRLHDELANDVFNTMTFIETQDLENETNKENVLQSLDAIYDKARSISKQTSEIKTGKEFGTQLNQLLMSYNSKQVTVVVKGSSAVDWEKIKANKQIEIHRTLSELLVNMKKHSQAKLVLVSFKSLEKTIAIQYKDNGIGFEKAEITKNGLQNVENRIHSIDGTITFESETKKGVEINIEFPK